MVQHHCVGVSGPFQSVLTSKTMGCHKLSESYDQQFSDFDFKVYFCKVYLAYVSSKLCKFILFPYSFGLWFHRISHPLGQIIITIHWYWVFLRGIKQDQQVCYLPLSLLQSSCLHTIINNRHHYHWHNKNQLSPSLFWLLLSSSEVT